MIRSVIILIFYFFTALSMNVHANERQLKLVFVNLPTLISNEPEMEGLYNRQFEELKRYITTPVNSTFMPPSRAYIAFDKGLQDCIFPANNSTVTKQGSLVVSRKFGEAHAFVYTLTTAKKINSESALHGIRLGIRRGFDYGGYQFHPSINLVEVDSVLQNMKMLVTGRIDAFVAYEPDSLAVFKEHPEFNIHRDHSFSIYSQLDQIACYKTTLSLEYINQVNTGLTFISATEIDKP